MYGLRTYVPWLREKHRLEAMVGPLGYWNALQSYQLNALRSNGLERHHTLLDIGCGPLQGGVVFIGYLEKGNYYGIDIDRERVEAGERLIAKKGLTSKFPFISVSHTFGQEELSGKKFDFIWASQIMYYFDCDKMCSLMKVVSSKLKDNGKFLGDIIGPRHYEFKTKEHGWILHSIESISELAQKFQLAVQDLGEIEGFGYPRKLELRTNILIEITKLTGA